MLRIAGVYLCVIVVAAAIAYLGNQLGRHIGKRKMSLWKLRPRHTSIIITTCTGALIAVLTLTIFAIFSEPVRGLLGGVEKLRQEEAALRATVASLKKTVYQGAFVWTIGEPIVHMTVPEGLSPEGTRSIVTSLLAEANSRTILQNNRIAMEKGEAPLSASEVLIDSDSHELENVVERISSGVGVVGLKIVARQNCLYRQSAPVRLDVWPVKLVYHKGEDVYRQAIKSDAVVTDFFRFVESMRQAAISKGMLPIDGHLGGGLNQEEFEALQAKMGKQHNKFYLVARAKRDLYETNSLDVGLVIEPIVDEQDAVW